MKPSIYVYDPTTNDELSRVRGVGRYLQILKENFSKEWIFTSNLTIKNFNNSTIFINPFFNFLCPPLLLRRIAKKQIAVIHDLIPLKYPKHFPAGIKGKINIFLNKLALKNYDLIITDSETSKKDIIQILNQPEDKVKVIYPCLPKIFLQKNSFLKKTTSANFNQSQPISTNFNQFQLVPTNYCLYVGDATWNKNLVNLAKAIKIINVPCIFVGKVFKADVEEKRFPTAPGTDLSLAARSRGALFEASTGGNESETRPAINNNSWQKELNQFLFETKNDKRFIFAGFVHDEQLIELYQKAELNILVSYDEGFGFSYFEAASQGCPSVLSNIPVLKETATDTALFCDPKNPNDIADQIGELYFNGNLRNQLGKKAKERLSKFFPKNFKKQFLSIF